MCQYECELCFVVQVCLQWLEPVMQDIIVPEAQPAPIPQMASLEMCVHQADTVVSLLVSPFLMNIRFTNHNVDNNGPQWGILIIMGPNAEY